jgi:hypothetical protein
MTRRTVVAAALCAPLACPPAAQAHPVRRADLPIPEWLFGWAAAVVLVVSFAALAALWSRPRLERTGWRPLRGGRLLGSRAVEAACGAIGVALLALVVTAGLFGPENPSSNFAPTFVFIDVWIGFVFASLLFGDVFRAFNPWRAIGRVTARALGREARATYPERWGRWPAAAGLLTFTWIELASGVAHEPRAVAWATVAYSVLQLVGMARFGVEPWTSRAETFSVYFNLFARVSVFETRDRVVGLRGPLGGLPRLDRLPGTTAVVAVMIGSVTFDGLAAGELWASTGAEWVVASVPPRRSGSCCAWRSWPASTGSAWPARGPPAPRARAARSCTRSCRSRSST